jgi:hypothetical protein
MKIESWLHANCSEWNDYGDDEEEEIDKVEAFIKGYYKSPAQLEEELKIKKATGEI